MMGWTVSRGTTHARHTQLSLRAAVDDYFYLFMSLLIVTVVAYGFGQRVHQKFLYPSHPTPTVLGIHAVMFFGWVLFYVAQSALVRTHNVGLHRWLGWFGVALGISIPVLGLVTAVVMRRFDLQYPDLARTAPLLRTAILDLATFSIPFALAICFRGKPEFHRRWMLIASCGLTAAAFVRFPASFHAWPWYYAGVDFLVLLGVVRDLIVNRRVHVVYIWFLPMMVAAQLIVMNSILHFWL